MNIPHRAILLFLATLAAGCAPIRVETAKPIQVDVNMKVELYQKDAGNKEGAQPEDRGTPVASSRRNRMAELQNLKDNRILGENQTGYVSVRDIPSTWNGQEDYIRSIANDENNDRQLLYAGEARRANKPLADVEREFSARIRDRAFPGEWIELPGTGWKQK